MAGELSPRRRGLATVGEGWMVDRRTEVGDLAGPVALKWGTELGLTPLFPIRTLPQAFAASLGEHWAARFAGHSGGPGDLCRGEGCCRSSGNLN